MTKKLISANFEYGNKYKITLKGNKNVLNPYNKITEYSVIYSEYEAILFSKIFNNEVDAVLYYEKLVEDLKNKLGNKELFDNEDLFKGLPVSFIIQFDINSVDDFEEIKTTEDNLINIKGIEKVEATGCKEIIKIYETIGIKGLKEYDKIYTIMDEQGVDGVTTYLDEHPDTRELLKDFIHF